MTDDLAESEEPYWFRYGATLRIFGGALDLDEVTRTLGLAPTHAHRRGERRTPGAEPYEHDMWSYHVPVPVDEPLGVHLQTLWGQVKPYREFLIGVKARYTVDVFCSYSTNCGTAGFVVPHPALEIFHALEIPFGVSVIV